MVFGPVARSGPKPSARVWVTGALLSVASASYMLYVASEEPFFSMSIQTLVLLEGFGAILLVLLGIWAKAAVGAAQQIEPRNLGVPVATFAIAWSLLCTCYLVVSMVGCLEDFQNYRALPGTLGSVDASRDTTSE